MSFQGDFYSASTSEMIRLETAGCLQKQMRVNSSTQGHSGELCLGSEPATCWSCLNAAAEHLSASPAQRHMLRLLWFSPGALAAKGTLVQMRCFCVRPSRVRVNACSCKCYSRQTIRKRLLSRSLVSQTEKKERVWVFFGFKIFMNLWIPLKDYNLSSISRCHTAFGDLEQAALMCKAQRQEEKNSNL